ncbi:TetR/AcrR family transcriptional regulator [Roseibium salinum]|uniref:TetR/AcrR family transcriptional regulator n=1 Tax=Roseibium salinum TaxID=1604349 RepID=A0ABT3QVV0_9HYPH|nr:TetR/AcrR family transcriptional regulator [Roseibium sp. DSM 29163]MCX2721050.1 TetR/AcrR family transcriptional regulator [Roseibium sp. DSM 29163]
MSVRKTAEERKDEILEAALHLSDEVGPDRLSTEAIAQRVGLTQPGIFRHFPTKQSIWLGVAEKISMAMQAGWRRALGTREDAEDRLPSLVLAQLKLIQSVPGIPAILFSRELHAENDLLRKAVLGLMNNFRKALSAEFKRGQADGKFRGDLDPDDAALILIGLVQGLAVRWSLSGRTFALVDEGSRFLDMHMRFFREPAQAPATSEKTQ